MVERFGRYHRSFKIPSYNKITAWWNHVQFTLFYVPLLVNKAFWLSISSLLFWKACLCLRKFNYGSKGKLAAFNTTNFWSIFIPNRMFLSLLNDLSFWNKLESLDLRFYGWYMILLYLYIKTRSEIDDDNLYYFSNGLFQAQKLKTLRLSLNL